MGSKKKTKKKLPKSPSPSPPIIRTSGCNFRSFTLTPEMCTANLRGDELVCSLQGELREGGFPKKMLACKGKKKCDWNTPQMSLTKKSESFLFTLPSNSGIWSGHWLVSRRVHQNNTLCNAWIRLKLQEFINMPSPCFSLTPRKVRWGFVLAIFHHFFHMNDI